MAVVLHSLMAIALPVGMWMRWMHFMFGFHVESSAAPVAFEEPGRQAGDFWRDRYSWQQTPWSERDGLVELPQGVRQRLAHLAQDQHASPGSRVASSQNNRAFSFLPQCAQRIDRIARRAGMTTEATQELLHQPSQ